MSTQHVIIGTGQAVKTTKAVINESLRDALADGDTIVVPWFGGKPSDALSAVYDYLLDREVPFLLLHEKDATVPSVFSKADHGVVQLVNAIVPALAHERSGGYAFVLGEDDKTDDMIIQFHDLDPIGMVDLSNGLEPVEVATDDIGPTPEPPPIPEDEGEEDQDLDVLSFTDDELEAMPLRILKNVAKGVLDEVPSTKSDIIAAIVALRLPEVSADVSGPVMSIEDLFVNLLSALSAEPSSRINSLVTTQVQQGLLWYHYGSDIENFAGE